MRAAQVIALDIARLEGLTTRDAASSTIASLRIAGLIEIACVTTRGRVYRLTTKGRELFEEKRP